MIRVLLSLLAGSASLLRNRRDLAIENLALRQQLALYKQRDARPRLSKADRAFWVLVSRTWSGWREALVVVKPETVIAWHRKGFRLYWTWKSRRGPGRPRVHVEVRELIRKMGRANPRWGAPRIHGELLKLGINVAQATLSQYMVRHRRPPSQTWRAFLDNHARDLVSTDFMVVPTATFRVLFVMVLVAHDRRRLVHFNVTANPTARWAAQQVFEAPKNKRARFQPLPRELFVQLKAFAAESKTGVLFTPPKARHLANNTTNRWLTDACEQAGVRRGTTHGLRHTAGSSYGALGYGQKEIADLLGHSEVRSAARYAHASDKRKGRAVDERWAQVA